MPLIWFCFYYFHTPFPLLEEYDHGCEFKLPKIRNGQNQGYQYDLNLATFFIWILVFNYRITHSVLSRVLLPNSVHQKDLISSCSIFFFLASLFNMLPSALFKNHCSSPALKTKLLISSWAFLWCSSPQNLSALQTIHHCKTHVKLRALSPFRRQGAETQTKVKYVGCPMWNTSDCQNDILALRNNLHIDRLVPMDFASNWNDSTFCKADLEVQTWHPKTKNIPDSQIIAYRVFRRYGTNFPSKTKSRLLFLRFPASVTICLTASEMNKEKGFIKKYPIPPFHIKTSVC